MLILQSFQYCTYVKTHSPTLPSLYLRHSSFFNPSFASPTSQVLHLIHLASRPSSFSNISVTSPTSQLIIQPFRRFTYVTAHAPTLPLLHLRRSLFSNPSFASPSTQALHSIHLANELCSFSNLSIISPKSQLILQPFRRFTYVTAHSPSLPLHHLRLSSFSNPSFASPTSQSLHLIHIALLILQPFCRFTYVTAHSPILPLLLLHHSSFSNPSFTSPTSQALHLRHLATNP